MATFNLGLVKAIHSGVNPPVTKIMLWFDEREKVHKVYNFGAQEWQALNTSNSGAVASFNKVYHILQITLKEFVDNQEQFVVNEGEVHLFFESNKDSDDNVLSEAVYLFTPTDAGNYGQGGTQYDYDDFATISKQQTTDSMLVDYDIAYSFNRKAHNVTGNSSLKDFLKSQELNVLDIVLQNAFSVSWSDKLTSDNYQQHDVPHVNYVKAIDSGNGLAKLLRVCLNNVDDLFDFVDKVEVVVDRYRHAAYKGPEARNKRVAGYRELKYGDLYGRKTHFEIKDICTWIDIEPELWFKDNHYPSPKGVPNGSSRGRITPHSPQVGYVNLAFKIKLYKQGAITYVSKYLAKVKMLGYKNKDGYSKFITYKIIN